MKQQAGVCEECGRRTAVIYAHANLCEWCWPASASTEAQTKPAVTVQRTCHDCGARLSDMRRQRCLDCEVNRVFDVLGERIEVHRSAGDVRMESRERGQVNGEETSK